MEIEKQEKHGKREIYTYGFPDYHSLTKIEKRALLLPLVEVIREFYQDPENRRKFEIWKAEYLKQSPADEQGFSIDINSIMRYAFLLSVV